VPKATPQPVVERLRSSASPQLRSEVKEVFSTFVLERRSG